MSKPLGVQYTPASVAAASKSLAIRELKIHQVQYVRVQWVDLVNNIRHRILPVEYFEKVIQSPRPSVGLPKAALGLVFITLTEGFSSSGEYLYVPDMTTLRLCPYAPGHASVMGWFEEKISRPNCDQSIACKAELCPRSLLQNVVTEAKALNLDFLVGFETEFILLNSTSPVQAVNNHGWCNSPALPSGAVETQVLEEIVQSLKTSGVEVQMYHAEAAPGQYEIVTGPRSPLEAADALIHTRETIFNIASKHNLRATLAPRVYSDNCGSACHSHISIHSKKPSPTSAASPILTEIEASFLSSVLAHLPALIALTLPIPASYKRMVDGVWSGGTYACWGVDNKEAPVRLCNATSPSSRNFEVKTLDGIANPYIALAGVLGAGLAGIKEGRTLEIKDCSGDLYAAKLSNEERQALGITQRLPLNWEAGRDNLSKSETLRKVLGDTFIDTYLAVNKTLADCMKADSEEAELTKLVENY